MGITDRHHCCIWSWINQKLRDVIATGYSTNMFEMWTINLTRMKPWTLKIWRLPRSIISKTLQSHFNTIINRKIAAQHTIGIPVTLIRLIRVIDVLVQQWTAKIMFTTVIITANEKMLNTNLTRKRLIMNCTNRQFFEITQTAQIKYKIICICICICIRNTAYAMWCGRAWGNMVASRRGLIRRSSLRICRLRLWMFIAMLHIVWSMLFIHHVSNMAILPAILSLVITTTRPAANRLTLSTRVCLSTKSFSFVTILIFSFGMTRPWLSRWLLKLILRMKLFATLRFAFALEAVFAFPVFSFNSFSFSIFSFESFSFLLNSIDFHWSTCVNNCICTKHHGFSPTWRTSLVRNNKFSQLIVCSCFSDLQLQPYFQLACDAPHKHCCPYFCRKCCS